MRNMFLKVNKNINYVNKLFKNIDSETTHLLSNGNLIYLSRLKKYQNIRIYENQDVIYFV